jgi:hypothetical protein
MAVSTGTVRSRNHTRKNTQEKEKHMQTKRAVWKERRVLDQWSRHRGTGAPRILARLIDKKTGRGLGAYTYWESETGVAASRWHRNDIATQARLLGYTILEEEAEAEGRGDENSTTQSRILARGVCAQHRDADHTRGAD